MSSSPPYISSSTPTFNRVRPASTRGLNEEIFFLIIPLQGPPLQARSSSLPRIRQQGKSTVEFEIKNINAIEKAKILLLIADDSRAISPKYAVMNAENNICDRKSEL